LPFDPGFQEKNGRRGPTESPALFCLLGKLNGVPEIGFGTALHFVADGPMILPKRVFGVIATRIHKGECPLKIVDQRFAGQFRQFPQECLVETVGVVGIPACVEQDESFADIHVLGLFGIELADDHDAAKDKQNQEKEDKAVLAKEIH
jgi:hypothetical protein